LKRNKGFKYSQVRVTIRVSSMRGLTKEEIVGFIVERTGLSKEEIERRITNLAKKHNISEHAAALILAEELNVKLEKEEEGIHLKDLVPGMNGVNLVVGVLQKFRPREYQKRDGSKGIVANLLVYDATGEARLVLWDSAVRKYYNELDPGDVIKIIDPLVKEGMRGIELHTTFRTRIIKNPEDSRVSEIPPFKEVRSQSYRRVKIGELEGETRYIEVRGTIVRIYRVTVYDACPVCKRKVDREGEVWVCPEHGEVTPIKMTVLDFGIDDGSGFLRGTIFGENATELLGLDAEEIEKNLKVLIEEGLTLREASRKLAEEKFYTLLGKEIIVRGHAVEDKFIGLILKAFDWDEVDYREEIARVRDELRKLMEGML